ncbi:XisH family protein [Nostoc sp. CHAB 5844]|nr:XisH family protein [Nostoc sp. CHAB 5844]
MENIYCRNLHWQWFRYWVVVGDEANIMAAKDIFHDAVRRALEKD